MDKPSSQLPVLQEKAVEIAEYRYPARSRATLPENGHYKLCSVRSGKGRWLHGSYGAKITLGDILLSPPGEEAIETEEDRGLKIDVLSVPVDMWLGGAGLSAGPRVFRRSPLAAECVATMRDCLFEKLLGHPGWECYITARAQMLLVHFHRNLLWRQNAPSANSHGDLGRARVLDYIRNLDGDFFALETLEVVAEKLTLSPRRFSELFREITGTTWLKHIHALRVLRAKKLLDAKDDSISMIAFQAGFQDITSFYRIFKNNVGVSPGEWRAQSRGHN